MGTMEKPFRIAIIGSGPIGKLLACSAAPHPRIQLIQYEADNLPLRPSFGYGVGPQTLHAAKVINPVLGHRLEEKCLTGRVWMHWWHGGQDDDLIAAVEVPEGKIYGRLGREELMELLDDCRLSENGRKEEVCYGKRLVDVLCCSVGRECKNTHEKELQLVFEDGSADFVNAIWAADGVNSLCRKIVQGDDAYAPPSYTGMMVYRGKVDAEKVAVHVGDTFSKETYCFIGVKGWHILIFPMDNGKMVNIAAFCLEPEHKRFRREEKVTLEELLGYFGGRNERVDKLLRLLHSDTPCGCQRLNISHMQTLGKFVNTDLCMTTFGDAANAMTPHIAGSMSCGFIGCATFIHEEWNPLINSGTLGADASNAAIAHALVNASMGYEAKHRPLAQKLVDISAEQGPMWSGGITDVQKLRERPMFLWCAADHMQA